MINEADFSALGLSEEMLAAVQAKGFETPTSIQRLTIPRLLSGENDIIAQSQTGTGKTAAFGLPILQQIEPSKGTAGFGGSDTYFNKILEQVRQSIDSSNEVIGAYMCQGRMPQSVRDRYIKMKENPEHPANLDMLIENFDRALSHPDADDLERLKKTL